MTTMAIFQDLDQCVRCNGCVLSCKRTWQMKANDKADWGLKKVNPRTRIMIKSQKRVDNGPFTRFSCWHCPDPPCVKRCPFDALAKQDNGAVSIDPDLCNPGGTNDRGVTCVEQCRLDCNRAGYPKVGDGSDLFATAKSWKCTMCWGRAGSDDDIAAAEAQRGAAWGFALPNNKNNVTDPETDWIPEKDHEPSCVYTCPAKAMKWDTRDNIRTYINDPANGYLSAQGDGSVYWASKTSLVVQPKADPYIEDHITPMVSNLLTGPFAKAVLVPTIFAGGLLAVIARRQQNMEESAGMREG